MVVECKSCRAEPRKPKAVGSNAGSDILEACKGWHSGCGSATGAVTSCEETSKGKHVDAKSAHLHGPTSQQLTQRQPEPRPSTRLLRRSEANLRHAQNQTHTTGRWLVLLATKIRGWAGRGEQKLKKATWRWLMQRCMGRCSLCPGDWCCMLSLHSMY